MCLFLGLSLCSCRDREIIHMLVLLLLQPGIAHKDRCACQPLPWHTAFLHAQLLQNTWGFNQSDTGSVCIEARQKKTYLKAPSLPSIHNLNTTVK